jgi:hypothetical protein
VAIFSADNGEVVVSSMLKHCSVLIDPINIIDAPPEEDILRFTLATSVSHASSERNGVRNNRSTTEEEEEDFEEEGAADDEEEEEAHIGDEGENFLPKAPRDEFFTLARKKDRRVVAFCGVVVVVIAVVVFIIKTFSSRLKSVVVVVALSFDDGEREV